MENYNKYGSSPRDVMMVMAKNSHGEYGKEVISGPGAATTEGVYFRQVLAIEDTVFSTLCDKESLVYVTEEGGTEPTEVDTTNVYIAKASVTITAGTTLFGMFYNIALTSGTAVCYKEAPGGAGVKF